MAKYESHYCQAEKVREVSGLTESEADDNAINPYIDDAQFDVIRDLTISYRDAKMYGNNMGTEDIITDGSNKMFWVLGRPVADINGDKAVDSSDVRVFLWKDESNVASTYETSIESVNERTGMIILSSAPSSDIAAITCDYSFYPAPVDMEALEELTALKAAAKYIRREMILIPEKAAHGAFRYTFARPWINMEKEYKQKLGKVLTHRWRARPIKGMTKPIRKTLDVL